ncbi:MAG: NAD-dependent succinate-semialdehyde dehydrogenase [Rhodobacteraceae bacterium]|nr:NAD-dependent succinate-semialdehyde dehydrogenase [Paracoccaceae bacterium]
MLDLKDPGLLETRGYIGGNWIVGNDTFDVSNPASGKVVATVSSMGVRDVSQAISSAYETQKTWKLYTGKERAAILRKWYDFLIENKDDLAAILTAEMGKPLAEAKAEILYGASFIEWFSEEAKRVYGDVIPGHQRDKRIVVLKQPVGVVGSITPWNFPNAMIARKVAPALAAGCSFVARPSELTPLSALAMAVLGERAGIPAGVFNVVPSADAVAIGKELCENPKVSKITFTGSTRVGKILMSQCASSIKKMSLELGGNAPFIVFDDADIDQAVEGAMIAKYRNGGQTCVCANRFYVQDAVYNEFAQKLTARVKSLVVGDGFTQDATIGPLINKAALTKVEAHVDDALSKGAVALAGGGRHAHGKTFYQPTVLANMAVNSIVATEETFGPVAPLFRFTTEDDVLELANDSEFGLAGYFYARDLSRVWRVAEALEVGMVGVNTGLISTEVAPFGGIKQSGLGREGSKYGIEDYIEVKYMCIGSIQ